MTWSILAHDPESGAFGVAVATCAFAVGASCPFLRAGVGAVSTQSFTNRYLGPAVLDAMERGLPPQDAIEAALAGDANRAYRQVHALDRHGRSAAWTGSSCVIWAGSASAPHLSVAGNMLAGPEVVGQTLASLRAPSDLPLPERMLLAMDAGEAAGGDRRGRQSAAMQVVTTEDFPDLDLRVDDHAEPLVELRRLLGLWRVTRAPGLATGPRKANPSGTIDRAAVEAGWKEKGLDLRFGD
ncbi:DUF1028 domain-containing protein [Roseomonas marmotae]|uniref:DUF1028 domain-containing protein n=1 Tax=Roseomonas marmotae TaxID=2768161 RepID=A0ABS3KBS0_9PROT|nr:DUF1028 domain-containing protein [Roseomonas marmotae]MBO1074892.1 DUF1028 domain-containing protein [Roseomonas marmotae]QTI80606.1 DUF1028 domain-containing protein [Roseomonas marmotae]